MLAWALMGVVISVLFFKIFDRMHKKHPSKYLSIQGIINKNAKTYSETPDGEHLLRVVISSSIGIGGVIAWPFLFLLLWHLIYPR